MSTSNPPSYNDDIADLGMMQLSDSFFPSGMYATSSGLEAIFYSKRKKMTPDQLRDLIIMFLERQIGPADCIALGIAYDCAARSDIDGLVQVDNTIHAMKLVQEIREASSRSGTQLLRCIHSFNSNNKMLEKYLAAVLDGKGHGPYPIAVAVASNVLAIPKHKAGTIMLYSFSVSVIGAALRLGMLQHFDGQKILNDLKPIISKTVRCFVNKPICEAWQFTPELDIIQIAHEKMASKMFIT